MAIILEGFDNSGKSTLAKALGLPILHPGPRPKTIDETEKCLREQFTQSKQDVVMDRVTAISMPAYGLGFPEFLREYHFFADRMLQQPRTLLIYCRPPIEVIRDFSKHETKAYDTVANTDWLLCHLDRVVKNYDDMMEYLPHVRYDWTQKDQASRIIYDALRRIHA